MKLLFASALALATTASAQEIVTLVASTESGSSAPRTNSVVIAEDQSIEVLMFTTGTDGSQSAGPIDGHLIWQTGSDSVVWNPGTYDALFGQGNFRLIYRGPGVVKLTPTLPDRTLWATLEISPGQYPPDRSAVIGERDGPMKATMEESTDLVNWTQSTSGETHTLTNANAKKFFRIKLERDVGQ